jgi:cytoskeletal protein RodZ
MPFSTSMLDEHSSGDAPQTYGARLKALREAKGLSLEQVSEATHIPPDKIEAIETGTVMQGTPAAYARGFVRIYAEYLETDVDGILDGYDEVRRPQRAKLFLRGVGPMSHKDYRPGRRRSNSNAVRAVLLVIVIAALLVGAAYVYVNLDRILGLRQDEPATDTDGTSRTPQETAAPDGTGVSPTPTAKRYELRIVAKENVTLDRVEQDGTVSKTNDVIAAGGTYTAIGETSVKVAISDASRVQIFRDGELVTEDLGTGPVTLIYDQDGFRLAPVEATGGD